MDSPLWQLHLQHAHKHHRIDPTEHALQYRFGKISSFSLEDQYVQGRAVFAFI